MTAEELEGLNLAELIDQLDDVLVPDPVPYTPETVGWWAVAGLLVFAFSLATFLVWRRRRRTRYRRVALAELRSIEARPANETVLRDLAALVRRTALAVYPRQDVAHLHGEDWRNFLNRSAGKDLGPGLDGIVDGPYRPESDGQAASESIGWAKRWIRSHHA